MKLSLEFFDKSFERFSTLSSYVDTIQNFNEVDEEPKEVHPIRILAVDDIETNLDILELFIHQKYPNIILDKASGGYEAIGMYKVNSYDLIFVDLKMPGLSGFDVFKKFQHLKVPPTTYALTADVYKDTYDKVQETGFSGLLEKPLKLDNLYQTIEEVINV